MEEFVEFLRNGLASVVSESLNGSVPLLNAELNTTQIIIEMVATFAIQLLIFVLLFLIIRFKFWNLVTNFIESREKVVKESLESREKALEEEKKAIENASLVVENSKKQANEIIEQARMITTKEVAEIKKDAFDEIEKEKIHAKEQLEHERQKMQNETKNEIIDVAFEMSKAIVEREIDRSSNQDIIDKTLDQLENK